MPGPTTDAIDDARAVVTRLLAPGPTGWELRKRLLAECAKQGQPLTLQAIHDWKKLRRGVPPARMHTVAKVLEIPVSQVRPDLFPPPRRAPDQLASEGPAE